MNYLLDAVWAWQATRPKVRPEWKFATFEPEQLARILEWQMTGISNAKVAVQVEKEFRVPCSDSDLSTFWSQLQPFILASRRRKSARNVESLGKAVEESPANFDQANIDLIKQACFDTLSGPFEARESAMRTLVNAFLKLRDQDASFRRIELLETQAAEAKEKLQTVLVKKPGGVTKETLRIIEEAARLL